MPRLPTLIAYTPLLARQRLEWDLSQLGHEGNSFKVLLAWATCCWCHWNKTSNLIFLYGTTVGCCSTFLFRPEVGVVSAALASSNLSCKLKSTTMYSASVWVAGLRTQTKPWISDLRPLINLSALSALILTSSGANKDNVLNSWSYPPRSYCLALALGTFGTWHLSL